MKERTLMKAAIALLALFTSQALWAQESVYCLAVSYYDSDEVDYFAFDASPVATYGEGTLNVTQEGEGSYSIEGIALDDVRRWTFTEGVPTAAGIDGAPSVDGQSVDFGGGKALVTGLVPGASVRVYAADGKMVRSVQASADGTAVVDLGGLAAGQVYVVRTPSASYKVAR